jgi:Sigma-70, region 4
MKRKMQLSRLKLGQGRRINRTLNLKKIRAQIRADREFHADGVMRPRHRMDCTSVPRPCPFISCRYNLYLDVNSHGSIVFNYPEIEPGQMKESCALDIAEAGDRSGEEIGAIMNVTRERICQINAEAQKKLASNNLFRQIARENGIKQEWIEYFARRHQKGDKSKE